MSEALRSLTTHTSLGGRKEGDDSIPMFATIIQLWPKYTC